MFNPPEKPNEKVTAKPASRYSYPQLAFKLPALAPGQNSIGTGGQYSIGADSAHIFFQIAVAAHANGGEIIKLY
jgi:hypothetical protein